MKRYFISLFALLITVCFINNSMLYGKIKQADNERKGNIHKILSASPKQILYASMSGGGSESPKPQQQDNILGKQTIRIINLGPMVNYSGLDYAPTVSGDGRTLFFVSDRIGSKLNDDDKPSHDFWKVKKAERLDTVFLVRPDNLDTTTTLGMKGVNTPLNEGASSISADQQYLYFTGCNRPGGLGDCDIYMSEIQGEIWGIPINLGPNVNSKNWDSQPSINTRRDMIFFTSNRPGPNGDNNMDIWFSKLNDMDEWEPAQPLTDINTSGKEVSPFIAADDRTLFFASDGHKPNFGGLDFYKTSFDEATGKWSTPENLGEPINTDLDEQFITLPAGGDVIYFSSRRQDRPGYQGNFDIFMVIVPKFFQTVTLIGNVIDECSRENIPASITVTNPITGDVFKDSLSLTRIKFELIIKDADYGKDTSVKYVDLTITAENPKYGKKTITQRITRPSKTENVEEAGKSVDEVKVTLTLGQMPVIGTKIDEATYIKNMKAAKPELADFRGLVMEEVKTWDLYPLLNYVFFDTGSSKMRQRYILFKSADDPMKRGFSDTTIAAGTLNKYYHLLNIYGFRLNKYPDAKIEIVGCNDGTTPEEKRAGLSKERAQIVFDYLKNVWGIEDKRMKITVRDKPLVFSNLKDSLGIQENRRVEILCDDWNIMMPIFDKDPKTFPQPEEMQFTMKNGIEDALVAKRRIEINRGGIPWKVLNDVGITDNYYTWDWLNEQDKYPKDEVPYTAQLIVTTQSGAECKSNLIDIPVLQVSTETKKVDKLSDSTLEKYSLILFPFDKFVAGPINDRIMRDYVYGRCYPSSVIEVIGHTDVVGLYDHNQRLSERRSNTVYDGILKTTKGKYGGISKRGVGEDEPLYDNSTPEGRFYNRTVQVIIKTPLEEFEAKPEAPTQETPGELKSK